VEAGNEGKVKWRSKGGKVKKLRWWCGEGGGIKLEVW
jgi:hypothetical protein